jgi:hypothetical protein
MRGSIHPKRLTRVSPRARLVAAAALASGILVAGCGGSSNSPGVASVSSTTTSTTSSAASTSTATTSPSSTASSSRSSTTAKPSKDPAQLLIEWASCMRSHGDPNQADPTVTVNKLISIPWNGAAIPGGYDGTNKGGQGNLGPGQYCRTYLAAAQTALQGGRTAKRPDQAALVKLSECMRVNGVPEFPDPTANGDLVLSGGPGTVNNPTFQNASKVCARKTGVSLPGRSSLPPGTITLSGAGALP